MFATLAVKTDLFLVVFGHFSPRKLGITTRKWTVRLLKSGLREYFLSWGKCRGCVRQRELPLQEIREGAYNQKEKVPATKKGNIQEWFRLKNLSYEEGMLKAQLLKIVNDNKSRFNSQIVDDIAKASGRIVLRLPPYHCELNPIELIWANIKVYVASHNSTFKFADMKELFEVAVSRITPENWQKCIEHTNKVEEKMWNLDNIMDDAAERLIIPLNGSDTSSSESDSD